MAARILCLLCLLAHAAIAFQYELAALPLLPILPFVPVALTDYQPRKSPRSYLRGDSSPEEVMVCFGDSLTHGSVSANWVERLEERSRNRAIWGEGYTAVLNAGVNSETAAAAYTRLGDVIACKPTAVTVLIGTNDLIGSLATSAANMYVNKLPAQKIPPSEAGYAAELGRIVKELDQNLPPNSRVLVLSPPPLGERPGGPAWRRGGRFAEICKKVVGEFSEVSGRVAYGPLYERVAEEMVAAGCEREFVWSEVWPQCITSPARLLFGKSALSSKYTHNANRLRYHPPSSFRVQLR